MVRVVPIRLLLTRFFNVLLLAAELPSCVDLRTGVRGFDLRGGGGGG